MKTMLRLGTGQHSHETTLTGTVKGSAYVYPVEGLPSQQQAWIADFKGNWQILRVKHGRQGDWSGNYNSAETAKAALQKEIDENSGVLADI
jgi:hypothetical protein